jgi:hypothetical protein
MASSPNHEAPLCCTREALMVRNGEREAFTGAAMKAARVGHFHQV